MYTRTKLLSINLKRFYHESGRRTKSPVVKVANSRVGQVLKSRRHAQTDLQQYDPTKRFEPFPFAITEDNKLDVLLTKVAPLYKIPYTEQLASKESFCRNFLRTFARDLYRNGTSVRLDVRKLPCPVGTIRSSPMLTKYRNKDEYSMWTGIDGQISVGYTPFPLRLHGDTICIEPNGCDIFRDESVKIANITQDFIRNQAKLPVSFKLGYEGGWRRISVRTNNLGELMVVGFLSPTGYKVHEIIEERDNFRDYLVERCKVENLKLNSLYLQPCPHNKCPSSQVPYELLHGTARLTDSIGKYKFLVSPESYFPTNPVATEVLFNTIQEIIREGFNIGENSTNKPLIIDASCGAGALSTHLSELASKVVGVDKSGEAVADAKESLKLNDVKNVIFLNVDTEIALNRIIEKYKRRGSDIIVVAVAPKSGLGKHVTNAIRDCTDIKKLIYITSKPDAFGVTNDLMELCKSQSDTLPSPFLPIAAAPVDTSPHVDACDLVIALERNNLR